MTDSDLYKRTLKSNSLFGGIKIFQIIVMLLRTKIVALLLGPAGMGIQALFITTLDSLQQFTTFGVFQSSVRDISQAKSNSLEEKQKVINTVSTVVLLTALFGAAICFFFSKQLSVIVFDVDNYNISFKIISLALFFLILSNGYIAIFQGLRELKPLAKASLVGAFLSVLLATPLYFFYGIKSIPIAILASNLVVFLIYFFYGRKIDVLQSIRFSSLEDLKTIGIPIINLGFILMLSNGIMTLFTLALNSYINREGGASEVGFFNAAITSTYGNLIIFTSILSSDYFPRLSQSIFDKIKLQKIVNHQIELLILIISPLICLIILFTDQLILLLYSREFLSIVPIVQFMASSLIFKVIWQAMSFIILAYGDKKTYFTFDAIIGNGTAFLLNIFAYKLFGLGGLGISYILGSLVIMIVLNSVMRLKYKIIISNNIWKFLFFFSIAISAVLLLPLIVKNETTNWLLKIIISIIVSSYCLFILNKRIDFITYLNKGKRKKI